MRKVAANIKNVTVLNTYCWFFCIPACLIVALICLSSPADASAPVFDQGTCMNVFQTFARVPNGTLAVTCRFSPLSPADILKSL